MALPKKFDVDWVNSLSDDEAKKYHQMLNDPQAAQNISSRGLASYGDPNAVQPERTLGGTLKDVGISLTKGGISATEVVPGLMDIIPGVQATKALENIGYTPREWKESLSQHYTPAQQHANQALAEAEGFWDTVGTAVQKPSTIAHTVLESLPSMALGAKGARMGLSAYAKGRGLALKDTTRAQRAIAAGAGEGGVISGLTSAEIRGETEDGELSLKQKGAALGAGALGGVIGAAGARAAYKLGVPDPETFLMGVGGGIKKQHIVKRIALAGLTEGVFTELPQEAQEAVWVNAALDRPLGEGVGEAAAMGMLAGAAMGGGLGVFVQSDAGQDKDQAAPDQAATAAAGETETPAAQPQFFTPEEWNEIVNKKEHLKARREKLNAKLTAAIDARLSEEEQSAVRAELAEEDAYWKEQEDLIKEQIKVREETNILETALKNDYSGTIQRFYNNPELLSELPMEVQENFIGMLAAVTGDAFSTKNITEIVSNLLSQNQRTIDSEAYFEDGPFEPVANEFAELTPEEQERIIKKEKSALMLIRRQQEMAAQKPRPSLQEIEANTALDRFANRIENHLSGFIEIAGQQQQAETPILEGPEPGQVIPIDYGEADPRRFDPLDKPTQRVGGKVFPRPQDVRDTNFVRADRQLRDEPNVLDPEVNTDPSEAQKEAGNYKKAKMEIDGLKISIENPAGSTRRGRDQDGHEWSSQMAGHYGYFQRSEGKDGDQVDVFVKPGTETSPKVFVVDQIDPKTGKFDEHKVVLGANDLQEAASLYNANYEEGWQGLGEITELSQDEFKTWLNEGKKDKSLGLDESKEATVSRSAGEQQVGADISLEGPATGPDPTLGNIKLNPEIGYRKSNKWVVVEDANGDANIQHEFKTKKAAEAYYQIEKSVKKDSSGGYIFGSAESPWVGDEALIVKKSDLSRIGFNMPEFHTNPQVKQAEDVVDIDLSDFDNDVEAAETGQDVEEVAFTKAGLSKLKSQAKAAYINGDLEMPQYMGVLDLLAQRKGAEVQQVLEALQDMKGSNLPEATRTFQAKGKADLSRLINMLGSQMYQGNLVDITVKETVQNSFDAVKAALKQKGPKGIKSGKIDIIADPSNRIIAIRDNGQGMNEQVLTEKLFTLGGTDKSGLAPGEAGGGFGMAKAAFLYGNEWIEAVTIKDGKRYSFKADRDTLLNREIDIQETSADPKAHGTTLVIKVPESINIDGQERSIPFPYDFEDLSFFKKPLVNPNLEVNFKRDYLTEQQINTLANEGSSSWTGEEFTSLPIGKNFNFENFNKPTKINFSWGHADLYIGKERKRGWGLSHSVLSAGVYQFNHNFEIGDFKSIPYDMIVNIFPRTDTDSPSYPFDVKREGFKSTVGNDVKALQSYLKQVALGIEAESTVEQFKNIKSLPKIELDDLGTNRIDLQDFITPKKKPKKKASTVPAPTNIRVKDGKVVGKDSKGKEVVYVDLEKEAAKKQGNILPSSMKPEKDAPKAKDFLIDVGIDDSQPIFHNNTDVDYFAVAKEAGYSAEELFSELGSVLTKTKDLIKEKALWSYRDLNDADKSVFTGISIDKGYHGVNTVVPFQAVLMNPLALKSKTLPGIVHGYYNTIVHEFAHISQRNHGESFISEMDNLATKLAEDGTDLEIKVALARIAKKHQNLINLLRDTYESSATKNIAKSLTEGDSSDGLASRRVADGPDGEGAAGYGTGIGDGFGETGQATGGGIPAGAEVAPENVSDVNIPTRDIPQEEYDRIHAQHKGLLSRIRQVSRMTGADVKMFIDRIGGSISTRLRNVSPLLSAKLRKLDFDTTTKISEQLKIALPIMDTVKKMSSEDQSAWDWATKNGDINRINNLAGKYGIKENYNQLRLVLDTIRQDAIDVGYDVGYIENYWPRILKDQEGFLQATQEISQRPIFTDALKEKARQLGISVNQLDKDLKADIISNIILGGHSGIGGPGNIQGRVFDFIQEDFAPFYMDSGAALMQYVYSMNKKIEARRFFGKVPEKIATAKAKARSIQTRLVKSEELAALMTSDGQDAAALQEKITALKDELRLHQKTIEQYKHQRDFSENISGYILELLDKKIIKESDQLTVKEILEARFHERGTTGIVNTYKNFGYIDTMGNPMSALTQIGDLAWAYYVGGLTPTGIARTTKNMIRAAFNRSGITKEDIGIERIAQEFADADSLSNAVSWVFKAVGLEKIDSIGKETLINTSYENYKAKANQDPEKLKKEIRHIFGKETNSVVNDLLADNMASENVKLLVYNRLLDFQPVALSEMPEKYLNSGNGRIFYMLKTYTLKQFDVFRREVYQQLRSDDPQQVQAGIRNMIGLVSILTLANAGADALKDLIMGRESKFEDHVIENFLTLGGASRYLQMQVRKDGAGSALFGQILPPFKFVDSLTRDVLSDTSEGLRSVESVPVVGKLYYWHFGRGEERKISVNEQEFKDLRKDTNKFKDKLDKAADKREFLRSNIGQFRQMKMVDNIQGSLNKNKTLINKLKDLPQTPNLQKRIAQLKQQREMILENFFQQQNLMR